jgi:hypothetical protein
MWYIVLTAAARMLAAALLSDLQVWWVAWCVALDLSWTHCQLLKHCAVAAYQSLTASEDSRSQFRPLPAAESRKNLFYPGRRYLVSGTTMRAAWQQIEMREYRFNVSQWRASRKSWQ